jgi:hypothetical protein
MSHVAIMPAEFDPRVFCRKFLRDRLSIVRGGIVKDENANSHAFLAQHARDAGPQEMGIPVTRDDHVHPR